MVSYRLVAAAGFFASVYALPLNINLGAYSPALVVGDGEISFGGGQDVSKLFNTLEGAAQSGSAAAAKSENAAAGSGVSAASVGGEVAAAAAPKAAAVPAEPAAAPQSTPAPEVPVAAAAAEPEVKTEEASVAAPDAKLQEQAAISSLQGMGKEIAPRADGAEAPQKRDLAGFDRALKYAEAALTKGPVIQMGTGEKGAGVGLIVDNRPNAAVPGGEGKAKAKRDEDNSALPRRRTKVTTMYVRRGVPAEMQTTEFARRGLKTIPVVARRDATAAAGAALAEAKRDASSSSVLDSINLNVDDPQGVTMTFVEETDGDDDE